MPGEEESRMSQDHRGGASGISRTPHAEDQQAIHMDTGDDTDQGIASADPTGAANTKGSSADAGHSGGVGDTGQQRGSARPG